MAIAHPILGAWRLRDWTVSAGGRESRPFGESPQGRLLYTPDGQMLAAIARAGRPPLSTAVPRHAGVDEKCAAFDGYFSYGGRFEIDGEEVVHHVQIALNPNFVGSTQRRRMAFEGDRLVLSAEEAAADGPRHHRLHWQRLA